MLLKKSHEQQTNQRLDQALAKTIRIYKPKATSNKNKATKAEEFKI